LGSEGEAGVGGVQDRAAMAVRAADGEGELALAAVAQGAQPAGDLARGSGRRVFVADDQIGAVALGQQGGGLGLLARLAALDLDDFDGTEAERSAARRGPRGVVQRELAFRRRAQPSDAQQRDLQRAPASMVCAEPTDQIFSIL
jgi:hypothetical protein